MSMAGRQSQRTKGYGLWSIYQTRSCPPPQQTQQEQQQQKNNQPTKTARSAGFFLSFNTTSLGVCPRLYDPNITAQPTAM